MSLPSSTYDTATLVNPGSSLTDFTLIVDLSRMSAAWWSTVDTSDGTKGRAAKDSGPTELACDWIDFDDTNETGWLRVKWSGTLATSGTQTLRVYPPMAANASVAASDTYGSDNAYDSDWVAYWPFEEPFSVSGTHVDRTANGNDTTWADRESADFVTGVVGQGIEPNDVTERPTTTSTLIPATDFSLIFYYDSNGAHQTAGAATFNIGQYLLGQAGRFWYGIDSASKQEVFIEGTRLTSTSTVSTSGYQHLAVTRASGSGAFYANGSQDGTFSNSTSVYQGIATQICWVNGEKFDDMQIHSAGRSSAWIEHEYEQTSDQATFWGTWTNVPVAAGISIPVVMHHRRMMGVS